LNPADRKPSEHGDCQPKVARQSTGLQWKNRATVIIGSTHRRRIWESLCGWYRVVHSRCLYGPRKGKQAIPDVFYAMRLVVTSRTVSWEKISEHRKQTPAFKACEKDAKKDRGEGQACDHCTERPPAYFGVRTLFEKDAQLCRQCWSHFHRQSRSGRMLPRRPSLGARRQVSVPSNQLSFTFQDEISD